MKTSYLGIDFGTTKTLVSRYDVRRGMPQVIRLGQGRDYVPTRVYVGDGGEFLFGESAAEAGAEKPSSYSRAFKMDLGSNLSKLQYRKGGKLVRCTSADLTRQFLEYILKECDAKSYPCDRAVITRPVNFTPAQLAQLEEAARAAGLTEVEFVTEPQAAGYAYCLEHPDDEWQNALVVDWGGGTLDMALVSKNGDEVEIHKQYQDGMSRGGENFDDALLQYARQLCMNDEKNARLWMQDEMTVGWSLEARKKVRQAKEDLSRMDARSLSLSSNGGEVYRLVTIQREKFEQSIRSDLEKVAQMVKAIVTSIKERELKPKALLLVGGSSRIPAVARTLEQGTGLTCRTWDMAGEAVSLGAAILAHRRWGKVADTATTQASHRRGDPPPSESTKPVLLRDKSLYRRGVELLYGIGCSMDKGRAVELFREGFARGDKNAGYMLVACLGQGEGVARDYNEAFEVSRQLADSGFYPAHGWLVEAYGEGKGTMMDIRRSKESSRELCIHYDTPIPPEVDPAVHYKALLSSCLREKTIDYHELERLARENYKVSDWPMRYSMLARALLPYTENSPSAMREMWQLLQQGGKEADPYSFILMASLYRCDHSAWERDIKKAKDCLSEASSILNPPFLWETALNVAGEEGDARRRGDALQKLWAACNYGYSGLTRKNELYCVISMVPPDYSSLWCVYDEKVTQKLLDQGKESQLHSVCDPYICLTNNNKSALSNLRIRICSPERKFDEMIDIPNSIKPGETLVLTDKIIGTISLGEKLYVRVSKREKYSDMSLDLTGGIGAMRYEMPPLRMQWEIGFWGRIVLNLIGKDGNLEGIEVVKESGAKASVPLLSKEESEGVGWYDFSDGNSLKPGEKFVVRVPGYAPIAGMIREKPVVDVDRAWGKRKKETLCTSKNSPFYGKHS